MHDLIRIRSRWGIGISLAWLFVPTLALSAPPPRVPPQPVVRRVQIQVGRPVPVQQSQFAADGELILVDRRRVQMLKQAENLLDSERHLEGIELLQAILAGDQDGFYKPTGDEERFRSLRAETQAIIGRLPEVPLQSYRLKYGANAARDLQEAFAAGSVGKVADVARLYFHTAAGAKAAYWLGNRNYDRGSFVAAAMQYEKLRAFPQAARVFEPFLSLRAAICWQRIGQQDKARTVVTALLKTHGDQTIRVAGAPRKLADLGSDIKRWPRELIGLQNGLAQGTTTSNWLMTHGNLQRNALVSRPLTDKAAVDWQQSTIEDPETLDPTEQTDLDVKLQDFARNPPANGFPVREAIVVGNIALTRTAANVSAYDLKTGQHLWQRFADYRLLALAGRTSDAFNNDNLLKQWVSERVWNDRVFGRLSSDGQRVYHIEHCHLFDRSKHLPYLRTNRLVAIHPFEWDGGLDWQVGGEESFDSARFIDESFEFEPLELAGRFFLGPPMPLGDELYCLAEHGAEIELNVLDARTGSLRWSQPLVGVTTNTTNNVIRRLSGAVPAYAEGVLVCPTTTGKIVALDLSSRTLLWAYDVNVAGGVPKAPAQPQGLRFRGRNIQRPTPVPYTAAVENTPVIRDGRVYVFSPTGKKLCCLDLIDGRLLWTTTCKNGRWVVAADRGQVVLVEDKSVRVLHADTGKDVHEKPMVLPQVVTGRGLVCDQHVYVPAGDSLHMVSIPKATITESLPAPPNTTWGQLTVAGGRLVSQGPQQLTVVPWPKTAPPQPAPQDE